MILPIAPSTYYRAKDLFDNSLRRSKRRQHDDYLLIEITRICQNSKCRYGARKFWQQLKAEGVKVARCTIMKNQDLQDVWRGKEKITTNCRDDQLRADDLVKRNSTASRPNQLLVADFTYIQINSGWIYTAFTIDVYARVIVGWKVSQRMNTDLVMAAL